MCCVLHGSFTALKQKTWSRAAARTLRPTLYTADVIPETAEPPKSNMSICSRRYVQKVLICGKSPRREIAGKQHKNTIKWSLTDCRVSGVKSFRPYTT